MRNGWRRVSVIVATIALTLAILGGLATLACGYGFQQATLTHTVKRLDSVESALVPMQADMKKVLRALGRIEGKLEGDGE